MGTPLTSDMLSSVRTRKPKCGWHAAGMSLASLLQAVTCSPGMGPTGVAKLCCWHAQMDEEKKAAEGAEEAADTSGADTTAEPVKEAAAGCKHF